MAAISSSIISSPYDPFLTTSEGVYAGPIFLAKIDLAAFGVSAARSLYLSTVEYVDPSGQPWEPILKGQPTIDQGGNFLESSFQPVDAEIEVLDKRITGQAVSETFLDLLADYEPNGAGVVFYQALENLTSTAQFRVIFTGKIEEIRDIGANGVRIWCVQDRAFSKIIPPNTINAADFPYAPTGVIGSRKQIVIGDWSLSQTIPTISVSGTETLAAGVARAMIPIPIIEQESASGGLESPRGIVSDEDMVTDPTRLAIWEPGVDAWAYSVTAPTISGQTYAQVAGDYQFYVPIVAIEDNGSTATNWQEATRKDKPKTLEGKVGFNYTATTRVLDLLMPEIQELGDFIGAFVYVWYNKNSGGASLPRFGLKNTITTDGLQDFPTAATSSVSASVPYGFASVNVGPTATGGSNTIQSWENIKTSRIYADVRTAGQTLEIHRIVLLVQYRPAARLVSPGTTRDTKAKNISVTGRKVDNPVDGQRTYRHSYGAQTSPDILSWDAPMFGFGKGVPDSGHATASSGHYTGTAGALIEHPCDVAHWALKEMGGESNIVTGSGEFGSFADARTVLSAYKVRCVLADEQDVEAFIEGIGRQTLTWFVRLTNTAGAPFVAIPWDTTSTADYRTASDLYTFTSANSDVRQGAFKAGRTPSRQVVNAVRVNYDYDPRTRTYGDQLYITPDGSRVYSSGFTTDGTRVTTAGTSRTLYGLRELVHNVPYVADPATASSILTRLFDLKVSPRVVINFTTWLNAFDLERGHVIGFSSDWDTFLTYPKPGGDGSWASKAFRVVRVTRSSDTPTQYRVVAVEV